MKKLLALVLVLVLSLTALVSCQMPEPVQGVVDTVKGWLGMEVEPDEPEVTYDIPAAVEYVKSLYSADKYKVTGTDYEVVSVARVAGVAYTVTWTVDNEQVKVIPGEAVTKIDVNEKAEADISYKLTFVVTAADGTKSEPYSFERTIPEYNVASFEEYMAAKKDDVLTVEGIVVAMCSKDAGAKRNHIYVADASGVGGYLNYNMTKDPVKDLGIKVGMTVQINGKISPSNGMQEFYQADVAIVDETIKTVPASDITALFTEGKSLDNYVARLVTIKGVTIGGQDLEEANSQYLYFSIGDEKAYIRTYVTDFPSTLKEADKATIDAAHAAKFGYTADVTGILVYYTNSDNPYLIPVSVDCFTNYNFVEKTDADKVAAEKAELKFEKQYTSDAVVDLVTAGKNYTNVVITWTSDNEAIVIADGKATITIPENETIVKLTATITCGEVTDTKIFDVKLSKSLTSIADAIEIGVANPNYTTDKYLLAGIITGLYGKEESALKYGNVYLTDENGKTIIIYGLYNEDGSVKYEAMENKPGVGDYVTVLGTLGAYNGTAQMKNGWVVDHATTTTIPAATEIGVANPNYTTDKYLLTGVIASLYGKEESAVKYGNVVIKDADGNEIIVYGIYDSTGKVRYDAMTTKPAVGDTITVLGILGAYNGTAQMKNGWLVGYTAATTDDGSDDNTGSGDNAGSGDSTAQEVTVSQLADLADGTKVIFTGTVSKITYSWSDTNKNMSVDITDGTKTINAYKLATKVGVGDVITVTGEVGSYNGTKQISEGATAVIVTAHTCTTYTDATCISAPACTVCGLVNGEALGHNFVNGVCTRTGCGVAAPTGTEPVTVSETMAALITAKGWDSSTTKQEFALDGVVTVKIDGGNNTGKAYNGDHIRIYATDTPAGTITITLAEGYELVSVKVSAQTGDYAFLCVDGTTTDICNTTTEVSGGTVVLKSVKNGSNGKQVRVTAIEVVYKAVDAE